MVHLIAFYLEEDSDNNLGYAIFSFKNFYEKNFKLVECGNLKVETTDDLNEILDLITKYEPKISVLNLNNLKDKKSNNALSVANVIKHLLFVFQIDLYEISIRSCLSEIAKNLNEKPNIFNNNKNMKLKQYIQYNYGVIPMNDTIAKAIILGDYILSSKKNKKKEVSTI